MSGNAAVAASAGRLFVLAAAAAVLGSMAAPPAKAEVAPHRTDAGVALVAVPEITVFAPEVVRRRVGTGRFGNPIEVVSLTRTVSYADLDLTKPDGANTLENRIRATAKEACRELDRRVPSSLLLGPHPDDCVMTATAEAMAVARDVIATARAGAR